MVNRKFTTLLLVGVLTLGSAVGVYASTNKPVDAIASNASKEVTTEQEKEADEQDLTAANTKTAITEEQAKQTALASVQGSTFNSIELEDEDGVIVYGVKIQSGKDVYDVQIDANTGTVLKSEMDNETEDKNENKNESKDSDNDNIQHENENENNADADAGHED